MENTDSAFERLCQRTAEDHRWADELRDGDSRECRNLRSLKMCRRCFHLHGPIQLEDGQTVEQTCLCNLPKREQKWYVRDRYYYDFNQEYEMCYCCGLEIIWSGSRWSSFYCLDCKTRIRWANELVRKCLVPYGRHSMMNGVSLKGEAAENPKAVAEFTAAVNEMNRRIGGIETHRTKIAAKQAERFKVGKDEPISALLLRSHGADRSKLKREAFIELIALVFGRTVDESRRFYEEVYGQ